MGKHAQQGSRRWRWLTRLTHHPRVTRWVATRDRVVLGAVGLAVGVVVLAGCGGSAPAPPSEPPWGEIGSAW